MAPGILITSCRTRSGGSRGFGRRSGVSIEIGMHPVLIEIVLAHATNGAQHAIAFGLAGGAQNYVYLLAPGPGRLLAQNHFLQLRLGQVIHGIAFIHHHREIIIGGASRSSRNPAR